MALTNSEKERLNMSMPVANDLKLGNIIAELQENIGGGGEVDAYTKAESDARFQPKGDYATATQVGAKADKTYVDSEIAKLTARIEALENGGGGG